MVCIKSNFKLPGITSSQTNDKCPPQGCGIDGITSEILKIGADVLVVPLNNIHSQLFDKDGEIPFNVENSESNSSAQKR